jgi:CheY-like chemotaxis protein
MRAQCVTSPFGVSALVLKAAPDVVVVDYNMPGLDGAHLVRLLRSSPRTAEIPVVFHSGEPEEKLAALAETHGAHYVCKGRGPLSLVDAIRSSLRGRRRPLPAAAQEPAQSAAR